MKRYLGLLEVSSLLLFLFLFAGTKSPALADEDSPSQSPAATSAGIQLNLRDRIKNRLQVTSPSSIPIRLREENREMVGERLEAKLTEAKLKLCQAREGAIKNRKESLLKLAAGVLSRLDRSVERIKEFYENTLLANGKKVENYDNLLAEIGESRERVVTSLSNAEKAMTNFNCGMDDPKGAFLEFRKTMQETKTYMHEYRKAIKNLLVAVRTAAKGDSSVTVVPSPTAESE
jgi:hypothetical protein